MTSDIFKALSYSEAEVVRLNGDEGRIPFLKKFLYLHGHIGVDLNYVPFEVALNQLELLPCSGLGVQATGT